MGEINFRNEQSRWRVPAGLRVKGNAGKRMIGGGDFTPREINQSKLDLDKCVPPPGSGGKRIFSRARPSHFVSKRIIFSGDVDASYRKKVFQPRRPSGLMVETKYRFDL
jgi:hypothetical protein